MNFLEAEIGKKHGKSVLDASLPAAALYEHRGYRTVGHGIYELENDVKLVYEVMEKNCIKENACTNALWELRFQRQAQSSQAMGKEWLFV